MSFRPVHLAFLGVPAALIAATLVAVTGSSSDAAEPGPYTPKFRSHTTTEPEFEPNAVLVKFKAKASATARKATASKLRTTTEAPVGRDVVKLTGADSAPDLLKKAKADPAVELASLNYRRRISAIPNDEFYRLDQHAYLTTSRVAQAWDLSKTTGGQVVAVLDTGVDAGHPDLVGHLVPGFNATSPRRGPIDDHGHGTMTLGIIAAGANNGVGVAGVGWNAKAMPVKVLASDGSGYDADIAEGIDWAVAHGAKVINMSLGGPGNDPVLGAAVQRAIDAGIVVVAASGNDGNAVPSYPAAYPGVIAVGATDETGTLTDFSNYGSHVDIAAPGRNILSTGPRSLTPSGWLPYWYCTGTSCSSPIVAGVAALVKNKWPTLSPAQVEQRLKVLSRDAGPRGTDPYYGAGNLDAYAALGGRFAPDFAGGVADGNDQPARATKMSVGVPTAGVINTEGDVDWYAVESDAARNLKVSVAGQMFDSDEFATNVGPRVKVYDSTLNPLAAAEDAFPDERDQDGYPVWEPLTASAEVNARTGTTYIAVSNTNGSRDNRQYIVTVTEGGAGSNDITLEPYPAMNLSPATNSSTATSATTPTITFAEPVNAGTVNDQSVRIVHGRTGAILPATVSYDAATLTATVTPKAPLAEATPYKLADAGRGCAAVAAVRVQHGQSGPAEADDIRRERGLSGRERGLDDSGDAGSRPGHHSQERRWQGSDAHHRDARLRGTGSSVKVTGLASATTYTVRGLGEGPWRQGQPDLGQGGERRQVGDPDEFDAGQLRRCGHAQGECAADRQRGVRGSAGAPVRHPRTSRRSS